MPSIIRREPVRVAYCVIIAALVILTALQTTLEHNPANLVAAVPIFITAIAGELARAKVTPSADSGQDAEAHALESLGDQFLPPAVVHPAVAELEALIPASERRAEVVKAEEAVQGAVAGITGLSEADLARIVQGVAATLQASAQAPPVEQPTSVADDVTLGGPPAQTPPPIQTAATPSQ